MIDQRDRKLAALARAVVATSAVLAGSLLLGWGINQLLVSIASQIGVGAAARVPALTVGALVPATAFLALRTRLETQAGARTLVGGLAMVGTGLLAFWMTSPVIDPSSVAAVGSALTYAVGLAVLASSHVAALLAHQFTVPVTSRSRKPSYRRSQEEFTLPADGGNADEELSFPLDEDGDRDGGEHRDEGGESDGVVQADADDLPDEANRHGSRPDEDR